MEDDLKSVFDRAKRELTHLHYRWIMYVELFGTNSHRIQIINKTASNLLVEFQSLVIDSMILGLSKFTDPSRMKGNSNLSFSYLIEEIERSGREEIVQKLKELLEELQGRAGTFRHIRNKRIAHNDLAVAIGSENSPLPGVSRADVNAALKAAGDFLNHIELEYFKSTTAYSMTVLPLNNNGRSLVIRLQKSLAYEMLVEDGLIDSNQWRELGNIDERNA
ncbi:hypothetical protein HCU74_16520 [Spongiibacter sp. KMU-166]|uniref:HEPN AbiU2-like domain-containing protein n=1 Tax=Spongiibacter thalassae TaxID=2721624 RepID=A0ABX1GLH7_9GAMM|nr:hypothetical protein [Spongiibacter thalassae]NKI19014.1 hypothetical protein [Spongiibacter thalassae]